MGDRKQASYNIHDYVTDNNSSFEQESFNEIDGLVLTQIANINFDKCGIDLESGGSKTLGDILSIIHKTDNWKNLNTDSQLLLEELASSDRYKDMRLSNYVTNPVKNNIDGFESIGTESKTEQFGAITITYVQNNETTNYMAFRATDGTTDGWNEDFLMVSSLKTQAQADSVAYMNLVGAEINGNIVGGGHSKGGNDFQYGYLFCDEEVRNRISAGYLYDSPGLQKEILDDNPNYEMFKEIIYGNTKYPQDSIIGQALCENSGEFIHSVESGLNEHDPYSWEINKDTSEFVTDTQSEMSKYINDIIDVAIYDMNDEEKKSLYTFISYILYNSGGEGIEGIMNGWENEQGEFNYNRLEEFVVVLKADWENMSSSQKSAFVNALGSLLAAYVVVSFKNDLEDFKKWADNEIEKMRITISNAIEKLNKTIKENQIIIEILINSIIPFSASLNLLEAYYNNIVQQYVLTHPQLKLHTDNLRNYAQRLQNVNKRIKVLDARFDTLYTKSGLLDLFNLIQADLLTGYSWRLERCVAYLNDTANDFEVAENKIKYVI